MTQAYSVRLYQPADKQVWDEFVACCKTPHFLFFRDFMSYHSDRFEDYSLLVFNEQQKLLALLPANRVDLALYSHQGLTFGGLLYKSSTKQHEVNACVQAIFKYLQLHQFSNWLYKALPAIYSNVLAQEDLYALHLVGATLIRRSVSSAIAYKAPLPYSKGRKWQLKKAKQLNWQLTQPQQLDHFWQTLCAVLHAQHNVTPVHSMQEMQHLRDCFPTNILCYQVSLNGVVCAGAVLFCTPVVAHAQYLFSTEAGRELGALDWLLDRLITLCSQTHAFFDFGISNERNGDINQGLLSQKEAFGARTVLYDWYEVNCAS